MRHKFILSTLLLGILSSGCAWMKPHYSDKEMHTYLFKKFDANGDGFITKEEYFAFIDQRFEKMDLNGDGTITKAELLDSRFYTFLPELAQAVFRDSDHDNSGTITKDEMRQAEQVRFTQMDKDSSHRLSPLEFVVNNMQEFKR